MKRHSSRKTRARKAESAHPLSLAYLEADPERLLSQSEAEKAYDKSPSWFERHRWARTGPRYHKIGRSVFYRAGDLLDFVRAHAVETTRTHQPQPSA